MNKALDEDLANVAHSLFSKNFFSLFHGSLSLKLSKASFLINTKHSILDNLDKSDFIKVDMQKRDYRWQLASSDAHIHELIYESVPQAKYVSYTLPPYATAYSLKHSRLIPVDYYGAKYLKKVSIYDPKHFDDWMERSAHEIAKFFKESDNRLLLIKGFGLVAYDRSLIDMAKKISILENSCKLLLLNSK